MKESYYFPHDYNARNDEKILKLISSKNAEGYAYYWMIIEMMYESGGVLRLDCDCIAFALRTSREIVKSVIHDFGLFEISENSFTSKRVQNNLQLRVDKEEKARKSALARWDANAKRTQCKGNAIKERKGKEKKGNKRKVNNIPTLEEIEAYIKERCFKNVNAKTFLDYFTVGNWIDSNGNPVKNWKQKLLTWEGRNNGQTGRSKQPAACEKGAAEGKYAQLKYTTINNDTDDPGVTEKV